LLRSFCKSAELVSRPTDEIGYRPLKSVGKVTVLLGVLPL